MLSILSIQRLDEQRKAYPISVSSAAAAVTATIVSRNGLWFTYFQFGAFVCMSLCVHECEMYACGFLCAVCLFILFFRIWPCPHSVFAVNYIFPFFMFLSPPLRGIDVYKCNVIGLDESKVCPSSFSLCPPYQWRRDIVEPGRYYSDILRLNSSPLVIWIISWIRTVEWPLQRRRFRCLLLRPRYCWCRSSYQIWASVRLEGTLNFSPNICPTLLWKRKRSWAGS